jgi:hypothetical protein
VMPDIYCPFPIRENPHGDDAEDTLRAALRACGAGRELGTIGIGRLAALSYPRVPRDALRIAALWFAFFWLYDEDWADRLPPGAETELAAVHRRVAALLTGVRPAATDHPAVRMLDLLEDAIAAWRPAWDPSEFHREILRYLQATLWEIGVRRRGTVPPLSEYLRMRPLIAAVPPSRALNTLLFDVRLAPALRTHPVVELAGAAAGDYSCWVNDLCSLERERGEAMNLVVVAEREFGWTRERALAWVASVARNEVLTFGSVRHDLASMVREPPAELVRYLDDYEGWFVASARWMPHTPRYRQVSAAAP